eukprot:CAMPEP_0172667048 /NCGR_PEP_ID=MMETSP1074-20121228/8180_1 /TAXON_ID=2916 /ORGANISM="Ceratium fusus, Strain PA161109" /LENGTH=316 /DNA_ID=CAMNT_0013483509 /DNA_START=22 /DNA_END=972 /DNA_ORIENTATION=-
MAYWEDATACNDVSPVFLSPKPESSQALMVIKDLTAGSIAGMAGVVVGHPLDIVKTRVQATTSSMRSLSTLGCLRMILQREGAQGMWRGIGPPTFAVAWWQGTVFASYELTFNKLSSANVDEDAARLCAGLVSGAASCFITVPTDAVKIKLQLDRGATESAKSSWCCARQMVARSGISSLFGGMSSCLWRDVPTVALYLSAYSKAKDVCFMLAGQEVGSDGWRAMAAESLAGGIAGSLSWAAATPLDVVKTVQQEAAAEGQKLNLGQVCRKIYHLDGMKGFLRGFGPLVIRAFPVNALTFVMYERIKQMLGVASNL